METRAADCGKSFHGGEAMIKHIRPSLIASILAGIVCGIGCNPMMLPSFVGPEPTVPPELHALDLPKKKGPVRVAILVDNGIDTREEFLGVDRQLGELLTKQMKQMAEASGDKLEFANLKKLYEYKMSHPNWQEDLQGVGKDLKADFVIYLEIHSMTLYERGSRELYRGRTEISVSLLRVGDEDDIPDKKEYHGVYPQVRNAIPVDVDLKESEFREQFMGFVAQRISWYFMKHPTAETYMDDK
jgi:hypothetical protein